MGLPAGHRMWVVVHRIPALLQVAKAAGLQVPKMAGQVLGEGGLVVAVNPPAMRPEVFRCSGAGVVHAVVV